jgi:hypothetical protein
VTGRAGRLAMAAPAAMTALAHFDLGAPDRKSPALGRALFVGFV